MVEILKEAILFFVVCLLIFFFVILFLVKRGSKLFMKFWGADFYTFSLTKRMAVVIKTSAIISAVLTVGLLLTTFMA